MSVIGHGQYRTSVYDTRSGLQNNRQHTGDGQQPIKVRINKRQMRVANWQTVIAKRASSRVHKYRYKIVATVQAAVDVLTYASRSCT